MESVNVLSILEAKVVLGNFTWMTKKLGSYWLREKDRWRYSSLEAFAGGISKSKIKSIYGHKYSSNSHYSIIVNIQIYVLTLKNMQQNLWRIISQWGITDTLSSCVFFSRIFIRFDDHKSRLSIFERQFLFFSDWPSTLFILYVHIYSPFHKSLPQSS